ncbi:hypothetical protein [Kitasatospora sp. NPDC088779]|uniref:phage tail protein n=1 Tax=Kitasatospora sp. NPDC088779 TaxID=3154964 RepID=UPI0034460BBF
MAGPGGRETGRLSVRVLPNTSNFAQSLQRYLDRIENRAVVKIRAVVDHRRLVADTRESMRELDGRILMPVRLLLDEDEVRRLRAELAHLTTSLAIPARVEADRSELESLRASVAALGKDSDPARGRFSALLGVLGSVGGTLAKAGTIPSLAGVGSSLVSMAPAASLAAPAVLAAGLAFGVLKTGMSGVSDALGGDADAFARLTPPAKAFVQQVRALGPAWDDVRKSTQTTLFTGLAAELKGTAKDVLPPLKAGMVTAAQSVNDMGIGLMMTASQLATSGAFGKALSGANSALANLSQLPALVVQGLVQIGAAAAPAFTKITAGATAGIEGMSARMDKAFQSGAMQRTLESAIAQARQLFATLANLGIVLGNVFGPAATAGAGVLAVLAELSKQLAQLTGTAEAQAAFSALFQTLAAVGSVVSGVLGAALQAALPLLANLVGILAGPIQAAAAVLAPTLSGLATLLFAAVGPAVSAVASALALVLPIGAQLIAQLATFLGPTLILAGQLFAQLAGILLGALSPILAQLPALLGPILAALTTVLGVCGQLASELLAALQPSLVQIGASFAELLVAVAPLLVVLGDLLSKALTALLPLFIQIVGIVGDLAAVFANVFSSAVTNVLVPALRMIVALLQGDFSGAWEHGKQLISGVKTHFVTTLREMSNFVSESLARIPGFFGDMAQAAWRRVQQLGSDIVHTIGAALSGFTAAIDGGFNTTVQYFAGLPGRLLSALGDIGSLLLGAGKDLLGGLLRGIDHGVEKVKSKLRAVTDLLPDWKGPPAKDRKILAPNGRLIIRGFQAGITDQLPSLHRQLSGLTMDIPALVGTGAAMAPVNSGAWTDRPGTDDLVSLLRDVAGRDVVVQIGSQEIARASALGARQLSRR